MPCSQSTVLRLLRLLGFGDYLEELGAVNGGEGLRRVGGSEGAADGRALALRLLQGPCWRTGGKARVQGHGVGLGQAPGQSCRGLAWPAEGNEDLAAAFWPFGYSVVFIHCCYYVVVFPSIYCHLHKMPTRAAVGRGTCKLLSRTGIGRCKLAGGTARGTGRSRRGLLGSGYSQWLVWQRVPTPTDAIDTGLRAKRPFPIGE